MMDTISHLVTALDSHPEVVLWRRVALDDAYAALRAATPGQVDAAAISKLRKSWTVDEVRVSLALAAARSKAAAKFPGRPDIVADVQGIEQATSALVADYKAERIAAIDPDRVLDLCCGVGGDTMSLARLVSVLGVDVSPLRAWMAGHNAECDTVQADVATIDAADAIVHIDPARRDEASRARRHQWSQLTPDGDTIENLIRASRGAAIKLGPGIDWDQIPDLGEVEIEVINEHGSLVQAVVWTGALALHHGQRTATKLPEGVSFRGIPGRPIPTADRPTTLMYAVDPAIERADLTGAMCDAVALRGLHPSSGLLCAPSRVASPWLTGFEVCWNGPWRQRTVAAWLTAHHAGIVEVKPRGIRLDTDAMQHALRGDGDITYTLFVRRLDEQVRAFITRRLED